MRPAVSPRAPLWAKWLGRMLRPWLKLKTDPSDPTSLVRAGVPVYYMLERYGLSNVLVLEQACVGAGLPQPLTPVAGGHLNKGRRVLALSRREGVLFRRPRTRTHSAGLAELLTAVRNDPELDIQLVPVSIFVGRAPDRQSGWFRVLFSENWQMVGRFRRLLSLLLNGRDTIVHVSPPISLRQVVAEAWTTSARCARSRARCARTSGACARR
jgi:glycerol-3-phosphate O-acyltransferase